MRNLCVAFTITSLIACGGLDEGPSEVTERELIEQDWGGFDESDEAILASEAEDDAERPERGERPESAERPDRPERPATCRHGVLRGQYRPANDDGVGGFAGHWRSANGEAQGRLRGRYGVRSDGSHVFFGKVARADGRFIGRVRGQWQNGEFRGRYQGRSGKNGVLRGHYGTRPGVDGGVFSGQWRADCDRTEGQDRPPRGERPERTPNAGP